nr:PDZ domain-containing protein [Chloroflexota bacterium]
MLPPVPDPSMHDAPYTGGPVPTGPVSIVAAPRRLSLLTISIVLVTLLAGSVLFLSGYSVGRQAAVEPGTPVSAADAFRPFWDTYDAITDRYAGGDIDRATIVQGAIRGMIDSLGDPYSSYLTSDQYRDSLLGISGQFEGVGAVIATRALDGTEGCAPLGTDCRLIVTRPLDGSPAEKAGVEAGDIVVSVDGTTLDGLTLDAAIERIRGPKGSVVTLTILRGTGAPIDIAITRDIVQSNEVDSKALANGTVGYIRLAGFSDAGADQVVSALNDHLAAGRNRLILDVRGNLGGYVTAARKIASQFIGSGVIFWEQDAQG